MKLHKFICISIIATIIAVGYVYQRVEIIKTGYELQNDRKHLSSLINKNSQLMYDLSKIESPKYLLARFDNGQVRFANRRARQSSSYQLAYSNTDNDTVSGNLISKFVDKFTVTAEAKTRK